MIPDGFTPLIHGNDHRYEAGEVGYMKQNIYAVYKGERFIDVGTADYLAKVLGITVKSVWYMATPSYRKRIAKSKDAMEVFKIEEDHICG